jgi:hypothetical protein
VSSLARARTDARAVGRIGSDRVERPAPD